MTLPMPLVPQRRTAVRRAYWGFGGGLDLISPQKELAPGILIDAQNYEINKRPGYGRIQGYERYDGRPSPSDATYEILYFDAGTTEPSVGATITGGTSGATSELLTDAVVESGSWAGNDAAGYFVVINVSGGPYQDNESLTVATANGVNLDQAAPTAALHSTYLGLAIEDRRGDIGTVAGDGDVLGVWTYNGDVYAFRDDSSVGKMYKATASGWAVQDLGESIEFTAGTTAFAEGETLTGGTSGATATIRRIVVRSGDWSTNDAAGHLTLYGRSGTFQAETGTSASGSATLSGASTANTLGANGSYQFVNYNFSGHTDLYRMYGCNGVGNAFEWDGNYFTKIVTGMTTDTPSYITAHKKHLFLAFSGGSVQHSGIGTPLVWSVVLTAAGEIALGDEVTGFAREVGNVLAITTRDDIFLLYGTSSADWDLKNYDQGSGAIANSVQRLGVVWCLDDRGVTTLAATQSYGDFSQATNTDRVFKWLDSRRNNLTASMTVREKSQYRLFFSTKDALYGTLVDNRIAGWMFVKFEDDVTCACSGTDTDGTELLFFGSSDGRVYQLDKGNSFDDTTMPFAMRTTYHPYGFPYRNKKFRVAQIDIESPSIATVEVVPEYNDGSIDLPIPASTTLSPFSGSGYWGVSNWSEFYWSGPITYSARVKLNGADAENMALFFHGSSQYDEPHQIQGATIHYSLRRLKR